MVFTVEELSKATGVSEEIISAWTESKGVRRGYPIPRALALRYLKVCVNNRIKPEKRTHEQQSITRNILRGSSSPNYCSVGETTI